MQRTDGLGDRALIHAKLQDGLSRTMIISEHYAVCKAATAIARYGLWWKPN
jgi:hypothetical protein